MRCRLLIFLFLLFCCTIQSSCLSQDFIEIDIENKEIRFINFHLAGDRIDGRFLFVVEREDGSLIFNLVGKNIFFNGKRIAWLQLELKKLKDTIFINNFSFPQTFVKGKIELNKGEFNLDVDRHWTEESEFLKGLVRAEVKIWGDFDNFSTTGKLTVREGIYLGSAFSSLWIDFFGKPPVLNITDSEVVLLDGSIFKIEGVLDLRDFANLIPNAELKVQKIFVDDWQMSSPDKKNVGLFKEMDRDSGIFLNTIEDEDRATGTELLYNWKDDNFLKLRMEQERTILGIEKRKEF